MEFVLIVRASRARPLQRLRGRRERCKSVTESGSETSRKNKKRRARAAGVNADPLARTFFYRAKTGRAKKRRVAEKPLFCWVIPHFLQKEGGLF